MILSGLTPFFNLKIKPSINSRRGLSSRDKLDSTRNFIVFRCLDYFCCRYQKSKNNTPFSFSPIVFLKILKALVKWVSTSFIETFKCSAISIFVSPTYLLSKKVCLHFGVSFLYRALQVFQVFQTNCWSLALWKLLGYLYESFQNKNQAHFSILLYRTVNCWK
ncbi:hypothetical protein DSM03_10173 [Leeuwenhoekiella aestuarii]|uniref:Uncharacterized protein n=1 Tax=Leeuwenhoekiella aestuarii TaxID=2249426 RepID=A0A4Q0NSJ7_9FLAO|nr:hypothetical protein DSM04_10466 [Leeuwenhoekiella aestuarii]RXG18709.1 hypothetical protein DSM03_10173 [Leeuwenhoekiella aestuarii]